MFFCRFQNGISTSCSGLSFDYSDPKQGNFMLDIDQVNGRGETSIFMTDLDGSLTGHSGAMVVKRDAYYTRGLGCEERERWNLDVCPAGTRFVKVHIHYFSILLPLYKTSISFMLAINKFSLY